ncbi:hypothetical protein M9Y10_004858 [Tritrichomonas musculus]|uniref:Serine/threonine-protein phosphatase 4 regulatory subunit 3-like central domain-containing protein n=1 Tax=Tritrichomonas musculus TaxID=1915356 RepID=A0ABR2JM63_9EUKA
MNFQNYKTEQVEQTDRNSSETNDSDKNSTDLSSLNEVLFYFNQNELEFIEKGINRLSEIIMSSCESEHFHTFFCQSEIIKFLINYILLNSLEDSYKIAIVKILYIVTDWHDDEYIEKILESPFTDRIYQLMNTFYPNSNEETYIIDSSQLITSFLSKLSLRTEKSRDTILAKFPNSKRISPFEQLFEFIIELSKMNIKSLQSYIYFFSCLCYYELSFDLKIYIYGNFIVPMFCDILKERKDLWEYLLQIIHFFVSKDSEQPNDKTFIQMFCQHEKSINILIESITKGSQKSIDIALKIMIILMDNSCDIFSSLDFTYLCQNICNPDIDTSIGIMNFIKVLFEPKVETDITKIFDFLFKNKLLFHLKAIFESGSLNQKFAALQIIQTITEKSSANIIKKIVRSNIISPMIEILEVHDFDIAQIVIHNIWNIIDRCIEDEIKCKILLQINEYGENLLFELFNETAEYNDEDIHITLELIQNKISEFKSNENVNHLIINTKNDESGANENEENSITFNQSEGKKSNFYSIDSYM